MRKIPGYNFLEDHPVMEKSLGLDSHHVIVTRKDWKEALTALRTSLPDVTLQQAHDQYLSTLDPLIQERPITIPTSQVIEKGWTFDVRRVGSFIAFVLIIITALLIAYYNR